MFGWGAPVTKQVNVTFLFGPAKTFVLSPRTMTVGGARGTNKRHPILTIFKSSSYPIILIQLTELSTAHLLTPYHLQQQRFSESPIWAVL